LYFKQKGAFWLEGRLKIGICQMTVTNQKEVNIARAREMIEEATAAGSRIVILPEMFNCPYSTNAFPEFAEQYPTGETIRMLKKTAKEKEIYLVGGSIPEKEGEQVFNTSFIFNPLGEMIGKHRKIHLFDVDLPSGLSFRESKTLSPGDQATVVNTPLASLGVAICYDIRFPELSRLMTLKGAQILIFPAAFNMTTGPAHWEMLFKTRAVDNQVFTVGASSARNYNAPYVSYGNSMVVDPWGNITARADEQERIIYAEIDLEYIAKIRRELPLLEHRRVDLY
jgi:predicted amidohydrolase